MLLPSKKLGLPGPDKVGSMGERGFTRMRARARGKDRPPLWYPQVEVSHTYQRLSELVDDALYWLKLGYEGMKIESAIV